MSDVCLQPYKFENLAIKAISDWNIIITVLKSICKHDRAHTSEKQCWCQFTVLSFCHKERFRVRPVTLNPCKLTIMKLPYLCYELGWRPTCVLIFHRPSRLTVSNALVRSTTSCRVPHLCIGFSFGSAMRYKSCLLFFHPSGNQMTFWKEPSLITIFV